MGDHPPPTFPQSPLSPGTNARAAELPEDRGYDSGAHPADESPGLITPALVFRSKTPWRTRALVPLPRDSQEHRKAPVQRAGKCPRVHMVDVDDSDHQTRRSWPRSEYRPDLHAYLRGADRGADLPTGRSHIRTLQLLSSARSDLSES